MKKSFMKFATMFAAAMFVLAACEKTENDDNTGNGGLKDPTEQGGNNNQGNENQGGNNNQGGTTDELHASLQGSQYVTISLDEYSTAAIQSKIKTSYQLDDTNVFFYIWENTYSAGTASGLNFYGEATGWTSLVVANVGWSGGGWCVVEPDFIPAFVDSTADLNNWYFHLAYKGAANVPQCVVLYWQGGEYKFAIGQGTFTDNGQSFSAIAPTSGTFQPNVWNEYEVCLADTGFNYATDNTTKEANLAAVLSGGQAGVTCDLDAIFFYKK